MSLRIRAGSGRRPAAARRIAFAAAVAVVALTACSTDNPLSLRPDVDLSAHTASLAPDPLPDSDPIPQGDESFATPTNEAYANAPVDDQPLSPEPDYAAADPAVVDPYAVNPALATASAPAASDALAEPAAVDFGAGTVEPYSDTPLADGGVRSLADSAVPVDPYAVNPDLGGRAINDGEVDVAMTRPVDPYGAEQTYEPPVEQPEPVEVMPADEVACREELRRLDVAYVDLDPIQDGESCGIDHPVKVSAIGSVRMKPAATLRCEMAAAFAAWTTKELVPAAKRRYLSGVKTIHQGSSYACRNVRRSGGVLSEHGKGNALDVSRIELNSGRDIDVEKPGWFSFRTKGFLNTVRADGCDYFTTVLGPGYDRDHKDHFHFDLKERRSGYRACR